MDKMGLVAIIIGLVLCGAGGCAIWIFLPEVVAIIKGLAGIIVLLIGLMLLLFGALVVSD